MATTRYRKNVKARLLRQQGGTCKYCRAPLALEAATLDHVLPKCLGGTYAVRNLVVACVDCNRKKGCQSPHLWLNAVAQGIAL